MPAGPIELPVAALSALVEQERAGELHLVLQPEAVWRPAAMRESFSQEVRDALLTAGLLDGRGRVDTEFLDLLPLLTRPSVEYYGWYTVDGQTRGALAAAGAMDGVLAVRAGDWVRVTAIPRDQLTARLLAELPEVAPGGGGHWSVALDELERAGDPRGARDHRLARHVGEVVKVVQRPVHGSGELYTASRDELGRRTAAEPLHYVDTDWGRYLNYTTGTDREARFVLEPAGNEALVRALETLRTA